MKNLNTCLIFEIPKEKIWNRIWRVEDWYDYNIGCPDFVYCCILNFENTNIGFFCTSSIFDGSVGVDVGGANQMKLSPY